MSESTNLLGSLADRIPKPTDSKPTDVPATGSWADETASLTTTTNTAPYPSVDGDVKDTPTEISQADGATEAMEGSALEDPEHEVKVTLADLQHDINSPLFSTQSFKELNISDHILQGLYAMGYRKPSKIQQKSLPLMLSDPPRNMIAQSQSGTGKTAAFVITILSRMDFKRNTTPQALVLAPSRELARQIEGVFQTIGRFVEGLTVVAAIPGSIQRGAPVQAMVIVGTPGTVMDLIKRRQLDTSILKVMTLDEADNMLDQQGLGEHCMRTKQMLPQLNQILLFSATFPDEVKAYAAQFAPNANAITLERDRLTVSGIKQMYMDCINGEADKFQAIVDLYQCLTVGSSIIFVKTRSSADRIAEALNKAGHKVVAVHGAFEGADRDRILQEFRDGVAKVLITTNVLARGIDVQSVTMVINYDIPTKGRNDEPDAETYLHRIGRTGRFGRVGVSISFVFDRKSFGILSQIAEQYNIALQPLNPTDIDGNERIIQRIIKSSRAGVNLTN
ncbi:ATP-dependent RNA helicase-like protein dbp5 [Calycina marina]|uniref:RNA helicase n=1 Tax=Calycina marina TaxID=1763456 RepID=A0A9P8CAL4_9HELO|nr:ATP-dependent RNA helicase-like protein dbp5 [Calycina marina]